MYVCMCVCVCVCVRGGGGNGGVRGTITLPLLWHSIIITGY